MAARKVDQMTFIFNTLLMVRLSVELCIDIRTEGGFCYAVMHSRYGNICVNYKGTMVNKGNHPQMAKLFRLVKYFNLPRNMFLLDAFNV